VRVKTQRTDNEKTQLRQPRSLHMPNECGRSRKWSQMNPNKTNEHKDANGNQWEEKAAPRKMQMKTSVKKKRHHNTRNECHNAKQEKAVSLTEGEGSIREKCCPRVKIPNFNSRRQFLNDVVSRQILSNFPQSSLTRHEEDIMSVRKFQLM